MIESLTASPTPWCPARPVLLSTPLQNTRYPAVANSVRPGLRVCCSPMTSQPSTLHFCKSTSAWPAPRRPVRDNERTFQVAILSSPVRLFGPSIQVHALLVCPPLSGFSSPTLRRPHLSSPPAYRICCLPTLVHLQSARFPRRCPEAGKNSTASGLSLEPITTNTVCSLGHRRRPNPLSYCCVGGITCVDRLVCTPRNVLPCNRLMRRWRNIF